MQIFVKKLQALRGVLDGLMPRSGILSSLDVVIGIVAIFFAYRYVLVYSNIEAIGLWGLVIGLTGFIRVADISGAGALARLVAIARMPGSKYSPEEYIDTTCVFVFVLYALLIGFSYFPIHYLLSITVSSKDFFGAESLLVFSLLITFFSVLGLTALSALDGYERADLRAGLLIFSKLVFLLVTVALVPSNGVFGLAYARVAEALCVLFVGRFLSVRLSQALKFFPVKWQTGLLKQTLSYGGWLQLNNLATMLFEPLLKIVVNSIGGLSALGFYEMASRYVGSTRRIAVASATPLVASFAKNAIDKKDKGIRLLRKANIFLVRFAGTLILAAIFFAPLLSHILFGQKEPLFLLCVVLLGPAFFVESQSAAMSLYCSATGNLKWNVLGRLVIAGLASVLAFFLGNYFGVIGVFLGSAIGLSIGCIVMMLGNMWITKLTYLDIFHFKETILWNALFVFLAILMYSQFIA